jgi:hypothetical protein
VVDLEAGAGPSNHHYLGCKRYEGSQEDRSHLTGLTIGAKKKIQMAKAQLAGGLPFHSECKSELKWYCQDIIQAEGENQKNGQYVTNYLGRYFYSRASWTPQ